MHTDLAVKGRRQLPVPVKLTDWGLPPPSSLNSTDAVRAPVAVGLNVALTVQLAPTPKVLPQVVVSEKSPAFAPKMAICHKFIVALPLLVNVIVCAALLVPTVWLAKVRLVGDGPPAVPTPVRIIDGGLPPALELMAIEDFRGPAAVGVKVTFSRQLPPGARGLGQL